MRPPRLLPLALLLTLLLPAAAADHAYSHRYVLFGRLVDADGAPMPNATIEIGFSEQVALSGACAQPRDASTDTEAFGVTQHRPRTDARGDFMACIHLHDLPGRGLRANLRRQGDDAGGISYPVDVEARQDVVTFRLPQALGGAPDGTHTVAGRLWQRANRSVLIEGVTVAGDTVKDAEVTVALLAADGAALATDATRTNAYGDFATRLTPGAAVSRVRVEARNETFLWDADPSGLTGVRAELTGAGARHERVLLEVVTDDAGHRFRRVGAADPADRVEAAPNATVDLLLRTDEAPHGLESGNRSTRPVAGANSLVALRVTAPPNGTIEVRCPVHPQTMRLEVAAAEPQGAPSAGTP
ncbi:MAG TPA: hypothetical protein VHH36_08465, partial [Candidatus Thermoplasmatota archaeon]|nr:hypothetical protein [Candidatus Thermoplasmatota archaeon]